MHEQGVLRRTEQNILTSQNVWSVQTGVGGAERWLTSAHGDPHEPEGHQPAHVHHYGEYEEGAAQDVVVGEEEEGLYQAETGNQVVLQSEMLLPRRRPADRVLRGEQKKPKQSALPLQRGKSRRASSTDLHFDLDGVQPFEVERRIPGQHIERTSSRVAFSQRVPVDADMYRCDRSLREGQDPVKKHGVTSLQASPTARLAGNRSVLSTNKPDVR